MSHAPETSLSSRELAIRLIQMPVDAVDRGEQLIDAWVREREAEAAIAVVQAAAINGCYCVCHSQSSSRPACVHCRPEGFIETADPYCGLTAKGVERILALATARKQLEETR